MITVDADGDFDTETLRLTRGFHLTILRVVGVTEGYCIEIMLRFPWISCHGLDTTSPAVTAETTDTTDKTNH